jgi:hypothetical protein
MLRIFALPTILLLLLIGVIETVRYESTFRPLNRDELNAQLRSEFKLQTLVLDQVANGKYSGIGDDRWGRNYEFDVIQSHVDRTVIARWKRADEKGGGESTRWTGFQSSRFFYLPFVLYYIVLIVKSIRNGMVMSGQEEPRQE